MANEEDFEVWAMRRRIEYAIESGDKQLLEREIQELALLTYFGHKWGRLLAEYSQRLKFSVLESKDNVAQ